MSRCRPSSGSRHRRRCSNHGRFSRYYRLCGCRSETTFAAAAPEPGSPPHSPLSSCGLRRPRSRGGSAECDGFAWRSPTAPVSRADGGSWCSAWRVAPTCSAGRYGAIAAHSRRCSVKQISRQNVIYPRNDRTKFAACKCQNVRATSRRTEGRR